MSEIKVSYETLRKILGGLNGDKQLKSWAAKWISERMEHEDRRTAIFKLCNEWLSQFVRNMQWDDPDFLELKTYLLDTNANDKSRAIDGQVHHLSEGTEPYLYWDKETQSVIWSPYFHRSPPFKKEHLPDLLKYINDHLIEV